MHTGSGIVLIFYIRVMSALLLLEYFCDLFLFSLTYYANLTYYTNLTYNTTSG